MFFEDIKEIPKIAKQSSCMIFAVPATTELNLKQALYLRPDTEKKSELISVEQIRNFCSLAAMKETAERFFVIAPAEAMNEAAENAFLKTFEEPRPYCHFILLTENPAALLPTILSRAQIYYLRRRGSLELPPTADEKTMTLAKKLIAAKPVDLIRIAEEISKDKKQPRVLATNVVAAAIEILYKSYFKTKNLKFLTKLENFVKLYENLTNNGHVKLHLVADLLSN